MGRDYDQSQVDHILSLVGLKDYIYQQPSGMDTMLQPEGKGLSKTLAHQILLARGFVGQPKGLIMENVLRYLDPQIREKVIDYIMKGPWTLIMVSDEDRVQQMADEVILMKDGNLEFKGKFEDYKRFKNK
jgi:ABC-type bacteriocin/lantibiotic exporter with double-glycine peptidase domain